MNDETEVRYVASDNRRAIFVPFVRLNDRS